MGRDMTMWTRYYEHDETTWPPSDGGQAGWFLIADLDEDDAINVMTARQFDNGDWYDEHGNNRRTWVDMGLSSSTIRWWAPCPTPPTAEN